MVDAKALKASLDILHEIERLTRQQFKKVASDRMTDEYAGACPFCGGKDRFKIRPGTGVWFCRQCSNAEHWNDIYDFVMKLNNCDFKDAVTFLAGTGPIDTNALKQLQVEHEAENKRRMAEEDAKRQQLLAKITATHIWDKFHNQMTDDQKAWWTNRGIPEDWQKEFRLGATKDLWTEMYSYRPDYVSQDPSHWEAFSIPYLVPAFQTIQFRYRVANGQGTYHNTSKLGSHAFITQPQRPCDRVVVHEGVIKAINGFIWGCGEKYQVVSVPSENTLSVVVPLLVKSKLIFVWLDPDAWEAPANAAADWLPFPLRLGKLIHEVNKDADIRYVQVNYKADDALQAGMTPDQYMRVLAQARPGKRIRI